MAHTTRSDAMSALSRVPLAMLFTSPHILTQTTSLARVSFLLDRWSAVAFAVLWGGGNLVLYMRLSASNGSCGDTLAKVKVAIKEKWRKLRWKLVKETNVIKASDSLSALPSDNRTQKRALDWHGERYTALINKDDAGQWAAFIHSMLVELSEMDTVRLLLRSVTQVAQPSAGTQPGTPIQQLH